MENAKRQLHEHDEESKSESDSSPCFLSILMDRFTAGAIQISAPDD